MSNFPFVSISTIEDRLHISRNYIRTVMLPHIRHEKTPQYRVRVDLGELRQWLVGNCEFSRQTELVSVTPDTEKRQSVVPPCNLRKQLPFISVKPFDFWDGPLLFPDDKRFAHAESFYRAMYACGAIKIKLGQRKSIFYAPELTEDNLVSAESFKSPYDLPNLEMRQGAMILKIAARLCPAADEQNGTTHTAKPTSGTEQELDSVALSIGIRGKESQYVEEVTQIIYERFRRVNIRYYNDGKSVQLTIPQEVFGKRK